LGALHDAFGWTGAPIALAGLVQTAALFMVLAGRRHPRNPTRRARGGHPVRRGP
jgi:hypothetical protein